MKLFLSTRDAYPWAKKDGILFRGYFLVSGQYYCGQAAVEYLLRHSTSTPEDLFLPLNGVFSVIWDRDETVLMSVDRLRGLPLFYAVVDGELWAADNAAELVAALPQKTQNSLAADIYSSTKLFVTGKGTLLQELFQIQAASACVFRKKDGTVTEYPYFRMEAGELETDSTVLIKQLHEAYQTVGSNLVKALNGRTAIVPLSGGADSRMVLSMLKQQGYEKVLCFTYGRPGNAESEISRNVAAEFGYPWEMVPYSAALWNTLRHDPILNDYCQYASAYSSTPHLQDFPAVKALHEAGKLPADGVFVPGHSGDMIAGSHITPEFLEESLPRERFLDVIIHKFFMDGATPAIRQYLCDRFPVCDPGELETMDAQCAWFNVQERQAKFIVNSVRVYEFFGYEWLIPLWDNTLFDFWKHVPISLRYQRRLYFAAVNEGTVPSTNDKTVVRSLAEAVRSMPGIRTIARRGTRILRYWNSQLRVERLFSPLEYLRSCFTESELFDANYLLCRAQLDSVSGRFMKQEIKGK